MNDSIATVERQETHRTEYRDGGVLSAAALTGDSASIVAARENHQATAHTGGIVAGLVVRRENGVLTVSPGAAIDSQGRMLLMAASCVPKDQPAVDCEVWLRYAAVECSGDLSDLNRRDETPRLDFPPLTEPMNSCDPVDSDGVLLAIVRNGQVETCCRRYVGAVGSRIDAPSKRARVVLGPQFARDSRRFAIGVQADPAQPIRDVFTWESTGTIRFSATTSVATPEEKQSPDKAEQPPVVVVGSPTVNVTPEDILDPCRVWTLLRVDRGNGLEMQPEILGLLSDCDRADLERPPTCRVQLTALLVRALNRLIRKAADYVLDAAHFDYVFDTAQMYQPVEGNAVLDLRGNEFTVTNVDVVTKTCEVNDAAGHLKTVNWSDINPLNCFPVFLRGNSTLKVPYHELLSRWRVLPGGYLCRVLLDKFLGDAIRPLAAVRPRGLFFSGSAVVDPEPSASRIHLVEFQKDGETFRQLRITIPDPGKENSPHRYRCSIGTSNCDHEPVPPPQSDISNRQTSWPRGILSVLADKSIDIHNELSVYAGDGILPGLILKLKPLGSAAGTVPGGAGDTSIEPTPILGNAVVWEGTKATRRKIADSPPDSRLVITGTLHNLTDVDVGSLKVLVSIYGENDTTHVPRHKEIVALDNVKDEKVLAAAASRELTELTEPSALTADGELVVEVPAEFDAGKKTIIVSLLVMGVNRNNAIICTQYQETLLFPTT